MVKNDMWYIYILLFFRILALENIAKILTTGPMLTHACLSATCVHAWIKEFSPGWWAVRAQLVEKSPDNFLVLNLFYSGGPMFISKKLQFFQSPSRGVGSKMSRGPTFSKVMGPNCFFVQNLLFSRWFQTPCSPYGFVHCLCTRVYVCGLLKSPKNEARYAVSSSTAYAFRVITKKCRQNYILFITFVLGSTSRNH